MNNKEILNAIRKQYRHIISQFHPWDLTADEEAEEVATFLAEIKRGEASRYIKSIENYIITQEVDNEEIAELTILINLCKCYR